MKAAALIALLLARLTIDCTAAELGETCSQAAKAPVEADYSSVMAASRQSGVSFWDLPGFTRSVYHRDHALITPESRVWAGQPRWKNALTAHLVTPASGASFSMFLADLKAEGQAGPPPSPTVQRFVLVIEGQAQATTPEGTTIQLAANHYVYFPPNSTGTLSTSSGAVLLVYEKVYKAKGTPVFHHGYVDDSPLLPVAPEVFELRKLLPQTVDYDFNIHIMDFQPGEHLYVKEVHYNQHGLLLLEGKGIYRLADSWYPVQAGDAIWMAPYVVQWYAALGSTRSRYIINKDTTVDPLLS